MDPCVPLPMEEKQLNELVDKAKDYLLMHGICMRRKDAFDRDALHFAPFLLLPSPFPKGEFELAWELQPVLNELMHNVAHDYEFLADSLKETIQVDAFTKRLFDIYETVRSEGFAQPISLGLIRSDVMLDTMPDQESKNTPFCCWKQVEINTIASGFGWMGPASGLVHRFVLSEMGRRDLLKHIPENHALDGLCEGMLEAWTVYGSPRAVIMFIVEEVTYNICDQKFHEFEIRERNPDVYVIRKTLTQVADGGELDDRKRLFVDGQEVALIYFRCGYSPDQYFTEREWDARLMMERSQAIKSPSIQYHLAGTKKVQQRLSEEGILKRFIKDAATVKKIEGIFTGLYALSDDVIACAKKTPGKFVIKPQREGGGNNVYGDDIVPFLDKIASTAERNAYIMMDMISPPTTTNYMVRPGGGPAKLVECVGELGVYGYCIGDEKEIQKNKAVGHCLRTKLSHVNEGGVAAGLGAIDSVFLVDLHRSCTDGCQKRVKF